MLQQKFNRRSTRSHVYSDWWGDGADWATNGMFDWKKQTPVHHCEPQIKKEKCPCCSKTISCANNLLKLLRSCEKATAHPSKRQLRQMTLDWPTSLENGAWTPKKLMVEEVQVGGASAEHAEHWKASEIVDFALMYMTLTFRKAFSCNNKRDILQRLKEIINSIKPVTEGQTWANMEAVKRLSMCQRLPTSDFKWLTDE